MISDTLDFVINGLDSSSKCVNQPPAFNVKLGRFDPHHGAMTSSASHVLQRVDEGTVDDNKEGNETSKERHLDDRRTRDVFSNQLNIASEDDETTSVRPSSSAPSEISGSSGSEGREAAEARREREPRLMPSRSVSSPCLFSCSRWAPSPICASSVAGTEGRASQFPVPGL